LFGFALVGENSVSETVVAEYISDFLDSKENDMTIHSAKIKSFVRAEQEKLDKLLSYENGKDTYVLRRKVEIPKNIAGIIMCAILSDTVIFTSPTCTPLDIQIVKRVSTNRKD